MRVITRSFKSMPAVLLAALIMAFAGMAAPRPGSPASPQKMINVPAGTTILIRMLDTVDSSKNPPGSRFTATLETNLVVGSTVVVPKGNTVYGQLTESKQAGRATGSSELQLQLTSIVVGGTSYPLLTSDYEVKGSSSGKRTAKRLLGGAGLGAVFGAIGGNAGKGAAIGAGVGAVGSVVQKGQSVKVPSETLLEFRLQQAASLPAR
jgi:hypothetical protein